MQRDRPEEQAETSRARSPGAPARRASDAAAAGTGAAGHLLSLQRSAGNQAVSSLLAVGQAKLEVGRVDDPLEREADAIARQVVAALRAGTGDGPDDPDGDGDGGGGRAVRRVQRRAVVGAEGGEVDGDTEQAIARARGRGAPLAPKVRDAMGRAFDSDFGHVRVHSGPASTDLNDRMQAKAFTIGSDIFFRGSVPDATTPTGQELLAHELAHTIQQGAGVQRRGERLQRKSLTGSLLKLAEALPLGSDGKVDPGAGGGIRLRRGVPIEVDVRRKAGQKGSKDKEKGWVKIVSVGGAKDAKAVGKFVKLSMLDTGDKAGEDPEGVMDILDTLGEGAGISSEAGDIHDYLDDMGHDSAKLSDVDSTNLTYAAGATDLAGMILTLAKSFDTLTSKDKDGWEKAEAALEVVGAMGSGASAIASIWEAAAEAEKGSGISNASEGLSMFGDIFDGIKATFKVVQKVVELVKSANDPKKAKSGQEVFHDTMDIASNLLEGAKSGVSAAKTFVDAFATNPASAALTNSVPGFGIAIGAADLIVRSVDLVTAMIQRARMQKLKRGAKEALGGRQGVSSKQEAESFIQQIDDRRKKGDTITEAEEERYALCEEYLLAKGVQWVNTKRANRALLKVAVAMGKIAGDVATLGGASAPVGIGLKAGALALDVGASLFRKFKQWCRDKKEARIEARAKKGDTTPVTGFLAMFNEKKSTKAKLRTYNKMVSKVFDMIVKAGDMPAGTDEEKAARSAAFHKIDKYVTGMGFSVKRMYAMRDDPGELRTEMIKALQKRE